jgi:parallel beta-helix repeat protein
MEISSAVCSKTRRRITGLALAMFVLLTDHHSLDLRRDPPPLEYIHYLLATAGHYQHRNPGLHDAFSISAGHSHVIAETGGLDPANPAFSCNDYKYFGPRTKLVDPLKTDAKRPPSIHSNSVVEAIAELPGGGPRTIYLRTGIYREMKPLILDESATDLSIVACPGETPVIDGLLFKVRNAQRVMVSGLIIRGEAPVLMSIDHSSDCVILRNTFVKGGTAILLDHARGNAVWQNLVLSTSGSGIELRDQSDNNTIADNVVDGAAAPETQGGGIFLHGVSGNWITHNLVQNTNGFGIGIANWDAATINLTNVVDYNAIRNTATTATDSGAIYVLGRSGVSTRTLITGNVIDKVGSPQHHSVGIYLDDSTGGTLVSGNVVRNPGSDAIQIHGGSDNVIENNLLDLGAERPAAALFQAAPQDTSPNNAQTGNSFTGNVIITGNAAPKIYVWLDGGDPKIAGNLYLMPDSHLPPVGSKVSDTHPVYRPRPPAALAQPDLYLQAQNLARDTIGFRTIDLEAAGPRHR